MKGKLKVIPSTTKLKKKDEKKLVPKKITEDYKNMPLIDKFGGNCLIRYVYFFEV